MGGRSCLIEILHSFRCLELWITFLSKYTFHKKEGRGTKGEGWILEEKEGIEKGKKEERKNGREGELVYSSSYSAR